MQLPEDYLRRCGITQFVMDGKPALRLPYHDGNGEEAGARLRLALDEGVVGREGLRWKKGSKPTLYGLWLLRQEPSVTVATSEAECHVLWHHGINAVGLPLDVPWREERDAVHLEGFRNILVLAGSDRRQDAVPDWVARSQVRERVQFVRLPAFENACAMHVADPELFQERWLVAVSAARSWQQLESERQEVSRREAWDVCAELAQEPLLLDRFAAELKRAGVVGVEREAKLLYLAATSRVLDRPVSVAVKGPSSAGKSFLVNHVLRFFPKEAFHALTAMSERALAYGDEPLQNRMLVLYEAEGMSGEWASYLIRSLLSEGEIRYETTEKSPEGLRTRLIERQGPTGLIVTTTRASLHPENETRLLSLTLADGPDQTRAILHSLCGKGQKFEPDRESWAALQRWIALSA